VVTYSKILSGEKTGNMTWLLVALNAIYQLINGKNTTPKVTKPKGVSNGNI